MAPTVKALQKLSFLLLRIYLVPKMSCKPKILSFWPLTVTSLSSQMRSDCWWTGRWVCFEAINIIIVIGIFAKS